MHPTLHKGAKEGNKNIRLHILQYWRKLEKFNCSCWACEFWFDLGRNFAEVTCTLSSFDTWWNLWEPWMYSTRHTKRKAKVHRITSQHKTDRQIGGRLIFFPFKMKRRKKQQVKITSNRTNREISIYGSTNLKTLYQHQFHKIKITSK